MADLFTQADIIHSYTRAEAIEDGVLIDASAMAAEAGIKYPVAITANAWETYIRPDDRSRAEGQSEAGRLWDVLSVFRYAARNTVGDVRHFSVLFIMKARQRRFGTFKAVCGPGDNGEPVITIMLPEED